MWQLLQLPANAVTRVVGVAAVRLLHVEEQNASHCAHLILLCTDCLHEKHDAGTVAASVDGDDRSGELWWCSSPAQLRTAVPTQAIKPTSLKASDTSSCL